jgi:hypothetical protein
MRKAYEIAIPAESFAQAVAFAMSRPEEVRNNKPRGARGALGGLVLLFPVIPVTPVVDST